MQYVEDGELIDEAGSWEAGVDGSVAVVEFGDKVKAKTILAGGQSGDPKSPHFNDQAQRYADVQFKDVAYYIEDVKKRAESTYHPGEKQAPNNSFQQKD